MARTRSPTRTPSLVAAWATGVTEVTIKIRVRVRLRVRVRVRVRVRFNG